MRKPMNPRKRDIIRRPTLIITTKVGMDPKKQKNIKHSKEAMNSGIMTIIKILIG